MLHKVSEFLEMKFIAALSPFTDSDIIARIMKLCEAEFSRHSDAIK